MPFYCEDGHIAAVTTAEIVEGEKDWHKKIKLDHGEEPEIGAQALCRCGKPIIFWIKDGVPNGV